MSDNEQKDYWTPTEIAEVIGRTPNYVLNAINQTLKYPPPPLSAIRVGRNWFIKHEEAQRFIALHLLQTSETDLRPWLNGDFPEVWKVPEDVVKWRFSFRSAPRTVQSISRAKKIRIERQVLGLVLTLTPEEEGLRIQVRLSPVGQSINLPPTVSLELTLQTGVSRQAQAEIETRWIQLEAEAVEPGEILGVKVDYQSNTYMERLKT